MNCCPSNVIPFTSKAVLSIPYTPSMQAAYGEAPEIGLFFINSDGTISDQNGTYGVQVLFDPGGNTIMIDNGGVFSGFVKIS